MKKYLLVMMFALACGFCESVAQNSGLGFNYQAVVRKADGVLLTNSDVNLRVSLYPGQSAASPTWIETHNVHTDYSGCFGITVGKGKRVSGSVAAKYADINFAAVYYWMKIEIQEGDNYREVSFAQLPSSPYSEVAYNAMMPAGMIVPFAGPADKIPAGWLLCDGRAVSRSEYSNLYNAIGVAWGEGNGSSTFNLPDLRGMFLRGVSSDSGRDEDANSRGMLANNGGNTGNNVGSYQEDAIRNIEGSFSIINVIPKSSSDLITYKVISSGGGMNGGDCQYVEFTVDASKVVPVGSDNRPKNVYVNYIIKF